MVDPYRCYYGLGDGTKLRIMNSFVSLGDGQGSGHLFGNLGGSGLGYSINGYSRGAGYSLSIEEFVE